MCRRIHRAAFGHQAPRRSSATAAAESPVLPTTIRVINIQSKPPPQPQHNRAAAAVSFEQPNGHQRSGIDIEDRFSDYIGRVRKRLRTLSTAGYEKRNSGVGRDSKFSDYISHVKNKFSRTSTTSAAAATAKPRSWIK
ncbi:unnamed protein product [Linum tenue]|uniref:Uncharacterized protein n=1 Tax=Linum tenue TaxID=586396 RepID=A0AAV0RYA3_9ROSI|nr:unnamed protein product [Linum tenue]